MNMNILMQSKIIIFSMLKTFSNKTKHKQSAQTHLNPTVLDPVLNNVIPLFIIHVEVLVLHHPLHHHVPGIVQIVDLLVGPWRGVLPGSPSPPPATPWSPSPNPAAGNFFPSPFPRVPAVPAGPQFFF